MRVLVVAVFAALALTSCTPQEDAEPTRTVETDAVIAATTQKARAEMAAFKAQVIAHVVSVERSNAPRREF